MKNKNVLSAVVFIAIVVIAGFFLLGKQKNNTAGIVCTMEAKQCSDGSYVGRSGPFCEFAACPSVATSSWQTFYDPTLGVTFKYPENFTTKYISKVGWPPKVEVTAGPFTCTEAGTSTAQTGVTTKVTVSGNTYCRTLQSEGAAGSIYNQYSYATQIKNKVLFFTFTLREVQCGNYPDPEKSACQAERNSFNVDSFIDQLIQMTILVTPKPNITYINSSPNDIVVEMPSPGSVTGKNFSVIGKVRGTWFFEATFPIELRDQNNKLLTTAVAQAQGTPGAWMTTNFVSFRADIKMPNLYIGGVTLVLKKDNPSGITSKDASVSYPITVE